MPQFARVKHIETLLTLRNIYGQGQQIAALLVKEGGAAVDQAMNDGATPLFISPPPSLALKS